MLLKPVISFTSVYSDCWPRASEHLDAPLFSTRRHSKSIYAVSVYFPLVIKLHGYVKILIKLSHQCENVLNVTSN